MRYYPLMDFQMVVLAVFLGLTSLILIYIGFRSYTRPSRGRSEKEHREEYPGGLESGDNPVPPLLAFVFAAVFVWAIVYVVVIGIKGNTF